MNLEERLEYCKKCLKREFDFKQGIICSISKQKPDFEIECENFEPDKSIIGKTSKKKKSKSSIAYGFSPKQEDSFEITGLTKKQAFVLAIETAKKLNWNIGLISESGFLAYTKFSMTSWSEEVQIKIEDKNIRIKSECTGSQLTDWGKNKENIDKFISKFKELEANVQEFDIETEYEKIAKNFVNKEDDIIASPLSKKEKLKGIFSVLKPVEGYFITPILININIIIFILMAISGVSIFLPSNESLLLWGANFRPITLAGEWWRLITSTFIHIGIFHLLMNMYALIYIGVLLEPYLGRVRFLSAYLLSGIAASVSSIYWNEITISAGASGAIFGLYGVFLAMLSTNLIEKTARKSLLISIGVFVGYNLLNGLKGGIDNAAHIGGLISGIIIGFIYYPSLIKPNPKLKYITIGLLTIIITFSSFTMLKNTNNDIVKYDKDMKQFVEFEQKALRLYQMLGTSTEQQILYEIKNNGLKNWENCLKIVENANNYELPPPVRERNDKLIEYCKLRIKTYQTIVKAIEQNTNIYDNEINNYNVQVEKIINELQK